ncbi:two-component system, NarL family, uhpT operon response regulator UhpA [Marisediminitalea aggregata]|uniref:Two-component system, NarL family, uhpT operon response regulator UhpA n=1 Tax=Marisediminitalea aggregata TaxID=634436 RepID=A0A1M5MB26_9ALTE|nr:response regulator transcription factor [Marisediminitalea aggregata]SHG74478.1 two-component system, NarL family, uhpT operon response regulator UhpA [Marisediminitalea aggregata]
MDNSNIRVLLVDDHEIVRRGFKALINVEDALEVSAEAANVFEAKSVLDSQQFDLIITDLSLPDGSGTDILRYLSERSLPIKSIVFSIYDREPYISEALNAGANGYLSKRTASDDIINAIHQVMNNNAFLSQDVLVNLSNSVKGKSTVNLDVLTSREREIFMLLAKGKLVKEVAQALRIMPKTAHSHRRNIFEKLNCTSSFELTQLALRAGLINSDDLIDLNHDHSALS